MSLSIALTNRKGIFKEAAESPTIQRLCVNLSFVTMWDSCHDSFTSEVTTEQHIRNKIYPFSLSANKAQMS